ncbi:MAG: DNA cytosine methyltransferase [Armatimonadota bacterium]|nr:DNA cytosine methyltransferase [Armatimonadota bacterium]
MAGAKNKPPFLDFFAGSGLVSEGLKSFFTPVWANDICKKKAAVFCANHSERIFRLGPIEEVKGSELPQACLSWGSFPCQDLSLAGNMEGILGERSGLVWQWLRVMDEMSEKPPIAVAENVVGLVSADKGSHYRQLHKALIDHGYKVGAVVLDAAHWVPQSRKRVFVIAVNRDLHTEELESNKPIWCHPTTLLRVAEGLDHWIWWRMPEPPPRETTLESILDMSATCYDEERSRELLRLVPQKHMERLEHSNGRFVFPGYKRIRNGQQVLELRFDGVAGCLRTPEGGSSRQYLVIKKNGSLCTRLLTVGETAALMGARKDYKIPGGYNDGYKAMGDAVAVPVVEYLARHILAPLANIATEKD